MSNWGNNDLEGFKQTYNNNQLQDYLTKHAGKMKKHSNKYEKNVMKRLKIKKSHKKSFGSRRTSKRSKRSKKIRRIRR